MPVVADLVEREQPAHLRDWFRERLIAHRLASVSFRDYRGSRNRNNARSPPPRRLASPANSITLIVLLWSEPCCASLIPKPAACRGIVEIASVDIVDGQITNPMSHLVRPDRPISPQAMAIHRITEEMVADKPWIEEIIPHYHGSPWYVAHNASFDRRVLPEMHGEWICTMKLARRLWPGIKYSNMGLYKSRKLNVTTPPGLHHHRALYDCYITAALLLDIINVSGWTLTKWPISPVGRRC